MKTLYWLFLIFLYIYGSAAVQRNEFGQDVSVLFEQDGYHTSLKSDTDQFNALVTNVELQQNTGTCTIANRLEKGFARKGNAFRQTITPDAANCASICGDTIKGCVAINYRESDKVCLFLADPGYVEIAEGYTTALLNPSLNYICHSDNMILNYDRPGGDILGNPHSVSSATDCCVLCYTTPNCIAYAYVTGDRKCWLKSSVPQLKAKDIVMTGLVCPKASA